MTVVPISSPEFEALEVPWFAPLTEQNTMLTPVHCGQVYQFETPTTAEVP